MHIHLMHGQEHHDQHYSTFFKCTTPAIMSFSILIQENNTNHLSVQYSLFITVSLVLNSTES